MTIPLVIAFLALVGTLIVLDLAFFTRRPHAVTAYDARASFALWALAAVGFSFFVGKVYHTNWQQLEDLVSLPIGNTTLDGPSAWLQFITCYVLEIALSLDNIAVLALLHMYYRIPRQFLPRALFWSVLISLVTRWGLIVAASTLLKSFSWFHWVLGGLLIVALLRTLLLPDESTRFDERPHIRALRRILPVSANHDEHRLITRENGRLVITPLFLVVIASSALDVAFAADSIPAMFAVTQDAFLAFTASAFAILGLRSLYFAISGAVLRFRYLKVSLVVVLGFITVKILVSQYQTQFRDLPTVVTLAVVSGVMMLGIGASMLRNRDLATSGTGPLATPRPAPIDDLSEAVDSTRRNFRKVIILIVGTAVILAGILIAPLPGPGPTVLIPIGLGILATEFVWARSLLNRLKNGAFNLSDRADAIVDRAGIFIIPLVFIGWWLTAYGVALAWQRLQDPPGWLAFSWVKLLVIFGSPFFPIAVWGYRYVRKWWKSRSKL